MKWVAEEEDPYNNITKQILNKVKQWSLLDCFVTTLWSCDVDDEGDPHPAVTEGGLRRDSSPYW